MKAKKNMNKNWIILGLVAFILLVLLGTPTEIKFVGTKPFIEIGWKIAEEFPTTEIQPQPAIQPSKRPDIRIDFLKSRQEIYQPGDTAYVDFEVTNELNVPYNITVDWLHNSTRYHGWFNISTDFYNTTEQKNYWNSWYTLQKVGEWKIHLVIKFSLLNKTLSRDSTVKFKVV